LVPNPLDEGLRPKNDKLKLNLYGTYFGGKINWFRPKNKKENFSFREPRIKLRTKVKSNSRI
jgi:hypothetical protein